MTRRYTPAPDALLGALAARLDALEETSARNTSDLTALGRGVADLTGQIRAALALDGTQPSTNTPTTEGQEAEGQEAAGQPDWLHPELDVEAARELLRGVQDWVRQIGVHHRIQLSIVCWPLHPDVVVDVLALAAERAAAYAAATPTGVSEWLTRWAPAARDRIEGSLAGCVVERGHRWEGRTYDLTGFDPDSAAAWWATERGTFAVHAFALQPVHQV